jgi:hypothetical protein
MSLCLNFCCLRKKGFSSKCSRRLRRGSGALAPRALDSGRRHYLMTTLPKVVHELCADEAAAANHYDLHMFIHGCWS